MRTFIVLTAVGLIGGSLPAMAAEEARSDQECAELLERWAVDPKAAPKRVIDACKAQLADAPAAAVPVEVDEADEAADDERARLASLDPCAGPTAADSVLCWGPWAGISPAAEGPDLRAEIAGVRDPETRPELADAFNPDLEPPAPPPIPELPLGGCPPGTPCGFATVVPGFTSDGDTDATEFARFALAPDGSQFTVSPDSGPIDSVTGMETTVNPRDDGYENLRALGRGDNQASALTARVVRDAGQNVVLAGDVWTHVSSIRPDLTAQSGYFAWGDNTTQAGLDRLNAGAVSLNFTGPMSVNNATVASMTVNFGANPDWTGNWTNPAWAFGAGGVVTGADLISQAEKFTANVSGPGSFVQGAILGEADGTRGIAHVIDVTVEGQGRIKDVGLLRDSVTPAVGP